MADIVGWRGKGLASIGRGGRGSAKCYFVSEMLKFLPSSGVGFMWYVVVAAVNLLCVVDCLS